MPKGFNFAFVILLPLLAACGDNANDQQQASDGPALEQLAEGAVVVDWDEWGVPHIQSADMTGAFYGLGWAHMELHGDLILELYGRARGRAAEYWGEDYALRDRLTRTLGIPERAEAWWDAHDADYQGYLEAYTQGMNDFAAAHPELIDEERARALPVLPTDPLAHIQEAIHATFVAGAAPGIARQWAEQISGEGDDADADAEADAGERGSNAWAIAPQRSASGNAMLLANPHLPWSDLFYFTEAQMTAPGLDVYGVTLVGIPFVAIGFNEHLGWTHTVNTFDGMDLYELELSGPEAYVVDGEDVPFAFRDDLMLVRQEDGTLAEQPLMLVESMFGPILAQSEGRALAVRIAGLDRPLMMPQYVDMGRATTRAEFTAALSRGQMPMFNTIYADADGDIAYFFNAAMPDRGEGDWNFWQGIVPGTTADNLWTSYHPFDELPQYANPEGGFVQNANDPPWTSTFPQAIRHADYPAYFAPQSMTFRPQHSARLMLGDDSITFEEVQTYADDTTLDMAVRLLPDIIDRLDAMEDERAARAADVFRNWNARSDADSRGTALFYNWVITIGAVDPFFADSWDPDHPLTTPYALTAHDEIFQGLFAVIDAMDGAGIALDVPYGEVFRLRYAGEDLPASAGSGGLGSFRTGWYEPANEEAGDGRYVLTGGNTFVAAVEFGDRLRARGYLAYGNSTQLGDVRMGDQLPLFSEGGWRDIHFYPEEIAAHTLRTEGLNYGE